MLASRIESCSIFNWYSTSTYNLFYPVVTRDYIFDRGKLTKYGKRWCSFRV